MHFKKPRRILCGVDIGSTKVCTAIGRTKENSDAIEVIGLGQAGLKSPEEFDLAIYSSAIGKAISYAQDAAGESIRRVWVNISSGSIRSAVCKSGIPISDRGNEIRQRDLERLIKNVWSVAIPMDREILHTIPLGYSVDGQGGILNPVGLYGTNLHIELHIVSALISYLNNIRKCIHLAGFEVEALVCSSIATGLSVLTDAERQSGVLLIDIGGSKTDICLFFKGFPKGIESYEFGGNRLTHSLSKALKVPLERAERQKMSYVISKDLALHKVIMSELNKIFEFIRSRIKENGWDELALSGVVVTGRSAFLDGMLESGGDVLGLPVRMGSLPLCYLKNNPSPLESSISYATSVGLLKYAATYHPLFHLTAKGSSKLQKGHGLFKRLLSYARDIWQEYF